MGVRAPLAVFLIAGLCVLASTAQEPAFPVGDTPGVSAATASVPRLIKFSGTLNDPVWKLRRGGLVSVTFALYAGPEDESALWLETQNVQLDDQGRFTVLLGATRDAGVPVELFASGEARWLGLRVEREPE